MPRTLLLTPAIPSQDGSVGQQFLFEACKAAPHITACYVLESKDFSSTPKSVSIDIPLKVTQKGSDRYNAVPGKAGYTIFSMVYHKTRELETRLYLDDIVDFARENRIEQIFAVLGSPSIIRIAKSLSERLKIRLITLVWDPPETETKLMSFDEFSRAELLKHFDQAQRAAAACAVASEGMKDVYKVRYKAKLEVLIRSKTPLPRRPFRSDCDEFVIGFAGTHYAPLEFNSFLSALSDSNWSIKGRKIRFKFIGSKFSLPLNAAGKGFYLELLGHRTHEETTEILSELNLAYLPYWFSPEMRPAVEQCFPDKFATYVSAGCPIFFHGPSFSSPARMIERYPVGLICDSLESSAIIGHLESLIIDQNILKKAISAQEEILRVEFSPEVFASRLNTLLQS